MNKKDENFNSFWISYADLMAGLLFVFLLLMGGVLVKYILSENTLTNQNKILNRLNLNLRDQKDKNLELDKKIKSTLFEKNELINENQNLSNQLENLTQIINDLNKNISNLILKNRDLNSSNLIILAENKNLQDLNLNLKNDYLKINSELNASKNENFKLNLEFLKNKDNFEKQKSDDELKIINLQKQINDGALKYSLLVKDLNETRKYIKNLTGIRIKIINILKKEFGNSLAIDPNSGALKLNSSILFDKGEAILKDDSKKNLKKVLEKYFDVLLNNNEINKNIDKINIEGFTDSDGGYIYNLELSQKRALAVLDFINSFSKDEKLRKLLLASGRGKNNLIFKNGKEDKEASRRIEIKFSISNKEAIKQIEQLLENK